MAGLILSERIIVGYLSNEYQMESMNHCPPLTSVVTHYFRDILRKKRLQKPKTVFAECAGFVSPRILKM
jgi:hypothetical protein